MKKIHILLPLMAILFSCWSAPAFAQDANNQNRVVIIKKSIDENGVETIEKTIKEGDDANVFIWNNENGEEMSFDLDSEGGDKLIHIRMKGDNGEEMFSLESNRENMEELKEQLKALDYRMNNENGNMFLNFSENNFFTSCNDKSTKPFLGIYMEESVENENGVETIQGVNDQGVIVQKVVASSAAETAGLQAGDIITAIDGQSTKRISNVSDAIKAKKIGDAISISYIRDGNAMQTTATLKGKATKQREIRMGDIEDKFMRGYSSFDYDFDYKVDPCKVFIGVYTGTGHSTNGLRVSGVIENTPAFDAGLQKGDRILALDGVSVDGHQALVAERDKHEAGDEFTITFLRDGDEVTVDAQFKDCNEEEKEVVEEAEVIEERTEDQNANNLLDINLSAFPNPTSSSVNVRFVGERTATIVTVTDIKGKEIYREELKNFDGLYNKKVNLNGAATGTIVVTVQQGNKVSSEKVLYIPERA